MKKTKIILGVASFMFLAASLFAGTPLSKTQFYNAYLSNDQVQYANEKGIVDGKVYSFLSDGNVGIDVKAAMINALSWDAKGKNSVDAYKMFLGRIYHTSYDKLNPDDLTGEELFCLAYMMVLDQSKNIKLALPYLEKAKSMLPNSYTVSMIYALCQAEILASEKKDCQAYKTCDQVRNNTSLTKDLDPAAIEMISENIDQYKNSCN